MRELKGGVAPSLYNPIYPIIRRHDALIFHLISRKERGRELCIGTLRIPLHFKQGKLTITLLQIINLLLLTGTPKIAVYISSSILIRLHSLTNEEVFPQSPHILPESKRCKVLQDSITYSIIIKVTMFANANAMTTVGRRSLEALRLQPLGKPPQCFS